MYLAFSSGIKVDMLFCDDSLSDVAILGDEPICPHEEEESPCPFHDHEKDPNEATFTGSCCNVISYIVDVADQMPASTELAFTAQPTLPGIIALEQSETVGFNPGQEFFFNKGDPPIKKKPQSELCSFTFYG